MKISTPWRPRPRTSWYTLSTHLRPIARLQREEKYREAKTVVMAYIQSLYSRRAPNATVRWAINAVRAVQGMEWLEPIVSRKLWRMAKYSLPGDNDDRRTFGGLGTLQLISRGVRVELAGPCMYSRCSPSWVSCMSGVGLYAPKRTW